MYGESILAFKAACHCCIDQLAAVNSRALSCTKIPVLFTRLISAVVTTDSGAFIHTLQCLVLRQIVFAS